MRGAGEAANAGADAEAHALLEATEAVHAALLGDGDLGALGEAYDRRQSAFDALYERIEVGVPPPLGAAARAAVVRVRALDAEILELGPARATRLRDERRALQRSRSATRAHASREREQARVVSVKV